MGSLTIQIRWRDMDAFQHVNNAVYATYFEMGRDALLIDAARQSGDDMERWVLRRVELDFVSQVTLDDGEVRVEVEIERIGSSSFTTRERLYAQSDARLCAEARAVLVHTDLARERSETMRPEIRSVLERLLASD